MRYAIVDTVAGQEALKPHLQALFLNCYAKPLPDAWWRYLYVEPPYGCAISVAAWDDEGLAGHYAAAPMEAVNARGDRIRYARGMTLAIEPRARAFGVLPALLDRIKAPAAERGLVCAVGFPNAASHVPLRMFCGWDVLYEAPFVTFAVPGADEPESVAIDERPALPAEGFCPPYAEPAYMAWRSTIHRFRSFVLDERLGAVVKTFQDDTLDVMDLYPLGGQPAGADAGLLWALARRLGLAKVCLPSWHAKQVGLDAARGASGDYVIRMGVMPIGGEPIPDLRFSLIFSDVF